MINLKSYIEIVICTALLVTLVRHGEDIANYLTVAFRL
jgi:hypothetical protein